MTPHFTEMLNILAQEFDRLNPQQSFTDSEIFVRNYNLANKIYDKLIPLTASFLPVVYGSVPGSSLGIADFSGEPINFAQLMLKRPSLEALDSEAQSSAEQIITHTFMLGLLYHLFFFNYTSRSKPGVDLNDLASEWIPKTPVASVMLRNYYKKENQGFAQVLFEHYFNHTLEDLLSREVKLGFWKRGRARLFLLNLFLAGALLGLEYDLQTEKDLSE